MAHGAEYEHVIDVGLAQSKDTDIWSYARKHKMVIISKDEDFFHYATKPESDVQFVWVRLGNCRKRALLTSFENAWPRIESCLASGDRVIELR